MQHLINSLRPRQNGRHFADDIFNYISLNENIWIPFKISLEFFPRGPINNIPALVRIMAWRHPGDKPLSEPMMDSLPTHICIILPQWVNTLKPEHNGSQHADHIFRCIFFKEKFRILVPISPKFISNLIDNRSGLDQAMAGHWTGSK